MKKMTKLIAAVIVLVGFASKVNAQASATATATATIVTPISLTKTTDMNFGNIAVSGTTAGTVILSPASGRTTGGAGGVTLPATAGTVAAAAFTVGGQANFTYAITLPSSALTLTKGSDNMTASTFTSSPSSTGTLDGTGAQTLSVGATLAVAAGQAAGQYVSGNFTVTVNYN